MKQLQHRIDNGEADAVALMGELPVALSMTAAQVKNMFSQVVSDPRVDFLLAAYG
jgi:hypothetical protein